MDVARERDGRDGGLFDFCSGVFGRLGGLLVSGLGVCVASSWDKPVVDVDEGTKLGVFDVVAATVGDLGLEDVATRDGRAGGSS